MTHSPAATQAVRLLLLSQSPLLTPSAVPASVAAGPAAAGTALICPLRQHRLSPATAVSLAEQKTRTSGGLSESGKGKGRYLSKRGNIITSVTGISNTAQLCWTVLVRPLVPFLLILLLLFRARRKDHRHRFSQVPSVVLILCLLITHSLAFPWVEVHQNSVKLRAQFCQPVPDEHLQSMLGANFDPNRMSNDDPGAAGKRSSPPLEPDLPQSVFDTFYEDDPSAISELEDEDVVELVKEDGKKRAFFREEVVRKRNGQFVEKKGIVKEEEGVFYGRNSGRHSVPVWDQPARRRDSRKLDSDQSYLFMKRRRRSAGRRSRPVPDSSCANVTVVKKKSEDSFIHLRLLLSARNRKLRRKLKKAFRIKANKIKQKLPPWTCKMKSVWGRLKEDYFPRYLKDGRCLTTKCFYRLYRCVPQRYVIKILKRDPDFCNPLPTVGVNSTYEQKWTIVRFKATIGCSCGAGDYSDPSKRDYSDPSKRDYSDPSKRDSSKIFENAG